MLRITRRAAAAAVVLGICAPASASAASWTDVPSANPKVTGASPANVLSPELSEATVATGNMALDGATAAIPFYGYDAFDGPLTQSVPEAHKTEPDKNTYLVLPNGQPGPDPNYDYGTHFVYQGHESGTPGYITRINLDADAAHRVTLLATTDVAGNNLPDIDGSTWDPWAQRLLFTAELGGTTGGVWAATLGYPSQVTDVSGALGRGGYEGIQNDSDGNLWIVEDIGGKSGSAAAGLTHARQPNSFVYRYVPATPGDLSNGKLQVLQVISARTNKPITFHADTVDADIKSDDTRDLHTYGHELKTKWVTIHDTATDGHTAFNANALAKAAGGTPLKRPENGQFVPGTGFKQFVFDETGDTNLLTEAGSNYGGFGGVQLLKQTSPSANTGTIRLLYQGNSSRTGFDNVTFVDRHQAAFVEDAGDTLHTQRNALDSGYLVDVTADYSNPATPAPRRFLAEGRDPSATFDADHSGHGNDGDNEITGIHASDGDPTTAGILGAKVPTLFDKGWRLFWTQQHGDNQTWEVTPAR